MQNLQQENEALKQENEKLLKALKKSQAAIDYAILGTPTGVVRDTLTKKNIEIELILNPELATIPKL